MANFSSVASEVYTILKSFDYVLDLYDDKSNKTYEPEDARKFFGSKTRHGKVENLLVEIDDLNELSMIRLHTGPSSTATALSGMWESLKTCATKYNMISGLETHDNDIHPKDFAAGSPMNEGIKMNDLTENMYGTSRSSYQRIGETKMIVRHSRRIDDSAPGSRSRNIDQIFIENAQGERHLLPVTDLSAGRAMGQHIEQGGSWADPVAAQINSMTGFFGDLGSSVSYMGSGALMEACAELREKCRAKRKKIRESFSRLFNESTYADEAARLASAPTSAPLLEGAGLETLREQLTIEKRKLPEHVFNACARLLAESNSEDECMIDEQAPAVEEDSKVVSVMGRWVNKSAWEGWKKEGDLKIKRTPNFSNLPTFKDITAQVMFKMEAIARTVVDDSIANLLSEVYDDYVNDRLKGKERQLAIVLGIEACKAAKVQIKTESDLGPQGVKAILEMQEWFASFHPDAVLLEKECKRPAEDCDADSEKADDLEDALDDCNDEVRELKKKVDEGQFNFFGHFSEDQELDEELTQEDILMPKDQGLDLADEVVAEPEDEEELERLLSLSGRPSTSLAEAPGDHSSFFKNGSWQVENIKTKKIVGQGFKTKQEADDSAKLNNGLNNV